MADKSMVGSELEVLTFNVNRWPTEVPGALARMLLVFLSFNIFVGFALLATGIGSSIGLSSSYMRTFILFSLLGLAIWGLVAGWIHFILNKGCVKLTPTHLVIHYRNARQTMEWANLSGFHISKYGRVMFENTKALPQVWADKPKKYGHRFIETRILDSVDSEEMLLLLRKYRGAAQSVHDPEPEVKICLLYTSPSPRDQRGSRMPSSA